MRVVALEEHWMAPGLMRDIPASRLSDRGWPPFDQLPPQMAHVDELIETGPARLRDMAESGVTLQILSAGGPGADLLDGADAYRFAAAFNDRLRQTISEQPDHFAGFAHLPMSAPDAAADELERAVTDLGLKGAMINGTTRGLFLDNIRFDPLLARAERLGVPLYIHPSLPPEAVRHAYYGGLPEE